MLWHPPRHSTCKPIGRARLASVTRIARTNGLLKQTPSYLLRSRNIPIASRSIACVGEAQCYWGRPSSAAPRASPRAEGPYPAALTWHLWPGSTWGCPELRDMQRRDQRRMERSPSRDLAAPRHSCHALLEAVQMSSEVNGALAPTCPTPAFCAQRPGFSAAPSELPPTSPTLDFMRPALPSQPLESFAPTVSAVFHSSNRYFFCCTATGSILTPHHLDFKSTLVWICAFFLHLAAGFHFTGLLPAKPEDSRTSPSMTIPNYEENWVSRYYLPTYYHCRFCLHFETTMFASCSCTS